MYEKFLEKFHWEQSQWVKKSSCHFQKFTLLGNSRFFITYYFWPRNFQSIQKEFQCPRFYKKHAWIIKNLNFSQYLKWQISVLTPLFSGLSNFLNTFTSPKVRTVCFLNFKSMSQILRNVLNSGMKNKSSNWFSISDFEFKSILKNEFWRCF